MGFECRPFSNVEIDFAGPLRTKKNRFRKSRQIKYKEYITVFVCFTINALHLEIVSDLSTPAFLDALDHFVYRRRVSIDIYSDLILTL